MLKFTPNTAESAAIDKVLVVYETPSDRERAACICGHLFEEPLSPPSTSRGFSWCPISHLGDPKTAENSAGKAADSDLIIFAVSTEGDFTSDTKRWIEQWLYRRSEREGAIVGLFSGLPECQRGIASVKEVYLRHSAHRAGMDYLSELPPRFGRAIPNSLDSYSQRAGQMTSLLDEILNTRLLSTPPL